MYNHFGKKYPDPAEIGSRLKKIREDNPYITKILDCQ